MVRTIRIKTEKFYKELLKVQGELQAKEGETKSMDDVIKALLIKYGRKI
ncbi:hypothetical protein AAA799E16_00378 [Marine Group I thaumarchaeote SCGC AAA799-E16]|uniref:Uncharacterized protein n=2 Tax=Marine Group I TaxID=905826 RepID=A0A087RVW6_9ARCH|nr:hypothetical protein AAA799E16_00378 [Marine Group I thaumarchaeote SCGC AAA799-E16]KFM17620.1 hypothetical protein SCCGRSA3_01550 [Marine Group I thaumarchaeote SCGC RSA3]